MNNQRICLTGYKGYIGSYLAEALSNRSPLLIDKKDGNDINDMNPNRVDLIYHLAAQTSVQKSFEDPEQDVKDNILATLKLLRCGGKIIFTSTAAVYGDRLDAEETDRPKPQSPYAVDKLAAEHHIINSGLPYVILRLGNVYGRNNNKGVIKALNEGGEIYGNGENTRDYIYIDDVVRAITMAEHWSDGIYNIGTGVPTSVNEVADLLSVPKNYGKIKIEQKFVSLNINKAKKQGWRPKCVLEKYYDK